MVSTRAMILKIYTAIERQLSGHVEVIITVATVHLRTNHYLPTLYIHMHLSIEES